MIGKEHTKAALLATRQRWDMKKHKHCVFIEQDENLSKQQMTIKKFEVIRDMTLI